jgi:hypothetical protein
VSGKGPEVFSFLGDTATVPVGEDDAQRVIDYFKPWLSDVTVVYRRMLEREVQQRSEQERAQLNAERDALERHDRVNRSLRV